MKKILLVITLLCTALFAANAQNFLSKVPSSSSAVIKYSGENFIKNVPLQKIDSYNFIKHNFFELLHIDTLTSLQNIGINFEQDTYQYITMEDSSTSFVTLLHLKNVQQFLLLIKGTYKAGVATKVEKLNGFDFLSVSEDTYIGWNETAAVIVHTTYENRKNYYDHLYSNDSTAVAAPAVAVEDMVVVDTVKFTPPKIVKNKPKAVTPTGKTKSAVKKSPEKNKTSKKELEKIAEQNKYRIKDSIENVKRELWEQQQDMIIRKECNLGFCQKRMKVILQSEAPSWTGFLYIIINSLVYVAVALKKHNSESLSQYKTIGRV